MKRDYHIEVSGCDDSTKVTVGLSNNAASVVTIIADLINKASADNCMPRMRIWLVGDPVPEYPEREDGVS